MKTTFLVALGVMLAWGLSYGQGKDQLQTDIDKVSYSIGLNVGTNMKKQNLELNLDAFLLGVRHAIASKKPLLSDQQIRDVMAAFQQSHRAKQEALRRSEGEKNKKDGAAFLASNKKKNGVTTTESGLQYKVIKAGAGKSPSPTDMVEVHYKGTLINGEEFDSSYKRGEPAVFPVNRVIPGWSEVLILMKPGAVWKVWIPSDLAYGERGAGPNIGPHSTLIFEITLISVK